MTKYHNQGGLRISEPETGAPERETALASGLHATGIGAYYINSWIHTYKCLLQVLYGWNSTPMPVPEKKLTPVVEPYDTTIAEAMDTQVHRERQVLAAEADIMAYSKMRK